MRPLDPRLLRYASAARATLAAGGLLALAQTAAVVAFAWLVTQLVVRGIGGATPAELAPKFAALGLVVVLRGLLIWLTGAVSARGGATVVGQLRARLVAAVGDLGPGWLGGRSSADVALVAGRGMDALDGYFASYLPQLVLTAIATPILVLVIGWQDVTSGIILVCTLPLIPVFMILVGWATQAAQKKQWAALSRLSTGFLDVVEGLATLKLFGRQHRQEARIRTVSEEYRVRTMRVLRMSFLSGFVLELAASLSVALIAVTIGLRLLGGSMELTAGLFVLLLAPEAFLPLRNVGASYHAATEGIEAASNAFEILDAARDGAGARDGDSARGGAVQGEAVADTGAADALSLAASVDRGLAFEDVVVSYDSVEVVGPFSARIEPGLLTVLSAPSGAGKSSLIAAALGFAAFTGRISADGRVGTGDRRDAIAWAGQRPGLIAGSIAENVALGDSAIRDAAADDVAIGDAAAVEHAMRAAVARALGEAAAGDLDPDTVVGAGGAGLSGGQAQRVAVARSLYRLRSRSCPVLVLDEPTSALDSETEARLLATLVEVARAGAAVLVVSHREAVVRAADVVLEPMLHGPEVVADVSR